MLSGLPRVASRVLSASCRPCYLGTRASLAVDVLSVTMLDTNWRLGRVAPAGSHPLHLPWQRPLPPFASPAAARNAHRQASRNRKVALHCAQPQGAGLAPAVEPERMVPAPLESSAASALEPSHSWPHHRSYLSSLYIKDFALVAEQRIHLEPGLNVITGESGSGKSVLVEALGQILGSSAYDEAVRQPATSAVIEGSLVLGEADKPLLAGLLGMLGLPQRAVPAPGAELRLRRELVKGAAGEDGVRSRCFLNGVPTSVRVLREVGRLLVDVNGQHAALALKDSARQLAMLDQVAGTAPAAEALAAALQRVGEARGRLSALRELGDEEEREAMQLLVDQVHAAGVEPGEDLSLRQQLRQMEGRRAAAERCRLVSVGLGGSGDGGVQEAIRSVELHVKAVLHQEEKLAAADRQGEDTATGTGGAAAVEPADGGSDGAAAAVLQRALDCLSQARDLLDEAEEEVVEYARQYKFSQADYDELYKRLQQLERLMKQHDVSSADDLLQLAEDKAAALDAYFQLEGQRDQLEAQEAQLLAQVQQGAIALSERRRQAAGKLRAAVESLLGDLAMAESRFDVRVSWTPAATAGSSLAGTNSSSSFRSRGQFGSRSSGSGTASSGSGRVDSIYIEAQQAQQCWEAGDLPYRIKLSGLDAVEFLFAAGPAEPLRPLSAVASGGESARIMLALTAAPSLVCGSSSSGPAHAGSETSREAVTESQNGGSSLSSSSSSSPIMILDEIDTGVGSRLGQPVGRILRSMVGDGSGGGADGVAGDSAIASQILCVSHLPQVAAHAQHHICVRKGVDGADRMVTRFESLRDPEDRLQEVSAMLGLPLTAAKELMAAADMPFRQLELDRAAASSF